MNTRKSDQHASLMLLLVAATMLFVSCTKDDPFPMLKKGAFSISATEQVRFAAGNLCYDAESGYSFADHQYEYGDHFGWGSGDNPSNTATGSSPYATYVEWGDNLDESGWRTLTHEEWTYLLFERPEAGSKRICATVCGIHGIIILPDDCKPEGLNLFVMDWETNTFGAEEWERMEKKGVLFLPAAGTRFDETIEHQGEVCQYWTSTPYSDRYAYYVYANPAQLGTYYDGNRGTGRSVRLVRPL